MARPRTVKPRSPRHALLGQAVELVMARTTEMKPDDVVKDSGLDEKQIGTYSRGQGNPTFTNLLKLCDGLHVSLAQLMHTAEHLRDERVQTLTAQVARPTSGPSKLEHQLAIGTRTKAAIWLPDDTYRRVDRAAKRLGLSRSEFFARAAKSWLAVLEEEGTAEAIDHALCGVPVEHAVTEAAPAALATVDS